MQFRHRTQALVVLFNYRAYGPETFARPMAGFFICYPLPMKSSYCFTRRSRDCFRLATLLVFGLLSTASQGNGDLFGVSLRLMPDRLVAAEEPSKLSPATREGLTAEVQYLDSYQREVGVFHPSLAPMQQRVAGLLAEAGDREAALKVYRAALHNMRINGGLNDLSQVPVLLEVMALVREAGDVAALRSWSDEIFRLQGQGAQPYDEPRLQGTADWLDREIELLLTASADSRWLLDTYERANTWRETICADEKWRGTWCRVATERVIALLYLVDYRIEPVVVTETRYSAYEREVRSQGDWSQGPMEQKLLTLDSRVASLGSAAIEQAMAIDDALSLIQVAADWAWYHNKRSVAAEHWATLTERGLSLSTPAPVPTLLASVRDPLLADAWAEAKVSALITASGRVRDCSPTVLSASDTITPSYVCRRLRAIRFRPAIDADGKRMASAYEDRLLVLRH